MPFSISNLCDLRSFISPEITLVEFLEVIAILIGREEALAIEDVTDLDSGENFSEDLEFVEGESFSRDGKRFSGGDDRLH